MPYLIYTTYDISNTTDIMYMTPTPAIQMENILTCELKIRYGKLHEEGRKHTRIGHLQ